MNPEQQKKMFNDALNEILGPSATSTPHEQILQNATKITQKVQRTITPIIAAQAPNVDIDALAQIVGRLYLESFSTWSKDDLLFLICARSTAGVVTYVQKNVSPNV